jgi:predicted  nucleic acid-binding Zn-ribbon protein
MHPEIEFLLVLQERDQRLSKLQSELARLPQELALLDQKQAAQNTEFENFKNAIRQIEMDRKKLDLEVQSKQSLVAKYKMQQQQTRKNEEFAALNSEIERTEKEISALEDQELELMIRYDEGLKNVKIEEDKHKALTAQNNEMRAALKKKEETLLAELEKVKAQQTEAQGAVSEETLSRYKRILASKKDAAVVPIVHGNCGGCHMKLTSQTVISAKSAEQLVACENCGRILYPSE